jgi:hypothetical protein
MVFLLAADVPDNYSLLPLELLSGDFANRIRPFVTHPENPQKIFLQPPKPVPKLDSRNKVLIALALMGFETL